MLRTSLKLPEALCNHGEVAHLARKIKPAVIMSSISHNGYLVICEVLHATHFLISSVRMRPCDTLRRQKGLLRRESRSSFCTCCPHHHDPYYPSFPTGRHSPVTTTMQRVETVEQKSEMHSRISYCMTVSSGSVPWITVQEFGAFFLQRETAKQIRLQKMMFSKIASEPAAETSASFV